MKSIPLLLIGTAYDGPVEEAVEVVDYEKAQELFGAYKYERFLLTPATTSITLSTPPWNSSVDILYDNSGTWEPYYLHNLSLDSNTLTFSRAGETKDVLVRFLRPAGLTNITRGLAEAQAADPESIYLMRIEGTPASTTLGTGSSYVTVESRYGGSIYNSVTFTVTGGFLKLEQQGNYHTRWLTWPTTAGALAKEINNDYLKGYNLLKATAVMPSGIVEGVSTITLTGGTNGTLATSALPTILARIDLPAIRVASILGTVYEDLTDVLTTTFFDDMSVPTMFVQNMRSKETSASSASYATHLMSGSPNLYFLSLIASLGLFKPYDGVSYWNGVAVPYATLLAKETISTSWKSIGVEDYQPAFSVNYIEDLANNGFIVLNRTISKGITVYKGTTSNTEWNSTCFIAYQTVCARLYDVLNNYIGVTSYVRKTVTTQVAEALKDIPSARNIQFFIVFLPTAIDVAIKLQVIGEIRVISFKIGVSTDASLPHTD